MADIEWVEVKEDLERWLAEDNFDEYGERILRLKQIREGLHTNPRCV